MYAIITDTIQFKQHTNIDIIIQLNNMTHVYIV